MVRWKHLLSPRSTTETEAHCDWFTRTPDPGESRNNCELQFQNDYEVNARQSLIWGGSFFSTGDDLAVDADIIPYRRRNTVESGFAQCESVQSCGWERVMARASAVDFWHLGPQSSSRSTSRDRRQRAF